MAAGRERSPRKGGPAETQAQRMRRHADLLESEVPRVAELQTRIEAATQERNALLEGPLHDFPVRELARHVDLSAGQISRLQRGISHGTTKKEGR